MKLVECVPNFSEGRDMAIINSITREIEQTDGVKLLDVDSGADTNRTVVTFIGTPEEVIEAAFKAIKKASEVIDMSKHHGAHARMGATDVCPFVPVSGVTMDDCVQYAHRLGKRVGEELGLPVYFYEYAATCPERRNLAEVRAGEYEGLPKKLADPNWKPDFGPAEFNPRVGATAISAREFLIAYNVNLNTNNTRYANGIALEIREKGQVKKDAKGKPVLDEQGSQVFLPGKFKHVKSVGWYIKEYGFTQISINFTNYKVSPPHLVFDEICKLAAKRGLRVIGSELVGLIPLEAILQAGHYFLRKQKQCAGVPEERLIEVAVQSLGLDHLGTFDPKKKIIEYCYKEKGPLVSMNAREFANELSIDSPAPGGGSCAALAGSLGASLASMVAHLTRAKKGYKEFTKKMDQVALEAQSLKDFFLEAMDEDTRAFNSVMEAMKLPKDSEAEKKNRQIALELATKHATEVPLTVLQKTIPTLKLAFIVAQKGNQNSVSDAGVSGLMAYAAAESAYYNIVINLPNLKDTEFKTKTKKEADRLLKKAQELNQKVQELVRKALNIDNP